MGYGKKRTPLTELIERHKLNQRGHWYTSPRFSELETAKAWGILPSVWDALSEDDKAQMMAVEQTGAAMRAYEDYRQERKAASAAAAREAKSKAG